MRAQRSKSRALVAPAHTLLDIFARITFLSIYMHAYEHASTEKQITSPHSPCTHLARYLCTNNISFYIYI